MVLNPLILLDFAVKNCLRSFDSAAGQIFAFGHDPDADHVIVLRDIPKPTLLRHIGDGGGALIDSRVALGAAIIRPYRNFVQLRIFDAPVVAYGGKRFSARAVQSERSPIFYWEPCHIPGGDT